MTKPRLQTTMQGMAGNRRIKALCVIHSSHMLLGRVMRLVATAIILVTSAVRAHRPTLSAQEIHDIAKFAYFFAYPLVLMEFTRNGAEVNTLTHLPEFPSAAFRTIVRPNADTLYSNAWLDLSIEPILLHVPNTAGRFYVVQLLDAWTETFASLGKRTTGTGEGWFSIVGPRWHGELPSGVRKLEAKTNRVWLLGRVQTNTGADYKNVHRIQKTLTLMPLSRYPEGLPGSTEPLSDVGSLPPPVRVAQLRGIEFFRQFQSLLTQNPAHAADAPIVKQLARLGLEAKKHFQPERLGPDGIAALESGVKEATGLLIAGIKNIGNGWQGWGKLIGRYGTDYLSRAQVARTGLGALPPEDAMYYFGTVDQSGSSFTGAGQYQMHFSSGRLPPVQAFWSLTLYDSDGYFTANSLNRYAIGDRDALQRNTDGSLDLWIQHDAPGGSRDSNWLPAPEGGFSIMLRLFWPKAEALEGRWIPPAVSRRQ